ncbi:hypothetical protein HDU92_006149 [Lobulomyces angularis]|nr:hypothetical protein HDU92_006149 [Lobulomyces angularis]
MSETFFNDLEILNSTKTTTTEFLNNSIQLFFNFITHLINEKDDPNQIFEKKIVFNKLSFVSKEILACKVLEENSIQVLTELSEYYSIQNENIQVLIITFFLIFELGENYPNFFNRLNDIEFLNILKSSLLMYHDDQNDILKKIFFEISVKVLYRICISVEFSLQELETFDSQFIEILCQFIEKNRDDCDEDVNFSTIRLLLAINDQFMKKNVSRKFIENLVVTTLVKRIDHSITLSENVIFMLNRTTGNNGLKNCSSSNDGNGNHKKFVEINQLLIINFLQKIFTTEKLHNLFYTNDLCVVLDVVIRELLNCDDNDELQIAFLEVLSPLIKNCFSRNVFHKSCEVLNLLKIFSGEDIKYKVKKVCLKVWNECHGWLI